MSDTPTLRSLLGTIQQAGVQAEMLRLVYNQPGATSELVENVAMDLHHLYEKLHDEIRTLDRWGDAR